eukprot:TRINITY_DN16815_c0_g1_i1.p1 TRINITY_DN16815_c0_g1~~TRINITY_DN16815_c0_g1_i1.p1  ORF type:complete len:404 (-),score=94.49 TRINITY_DN16815_c0_g1_i1:23-1234(-)
MSEDTRRHHQELPAPPEPVYDVPNQRDPDVVDSGHQTPYTNWKMESMEADEAMVDARHQQEEEEPKTARGGGQNNNVHQQQQQQQPPQVAAPTVLKRPTAATHSASGINESSVDHHHHSTDNHSTTKTTSPQPSKPVHRAAAAPVAPAPARKEQQAAMHRHTTATEASTATTSTPQTSSCGSNPSDYFRRLQASVQQKIQTNQELHKSTIEGLQSKYAQYLMQNPPQGGDNDDNQSDMTSVTEPDVDDTYIDSSSDIAGDSPAQKKSSCRHCRGGHRCCDHPFEKKESPNVSLASRVNYFQRREEEHQTSTTTNGRQTHFADPNTSTLRNMAGTSATILNESETETTTSMAGAITRPHTRNSVSYTHLRAHETPEHLVCRLLLEKKKKTQKHTKIEMTKITKE